MRAQMTWNTVLSRPIRVKDGSTLKTLADARAYILELPSEVTARPSWRDAAETLVEAAEGRATVAEASQKVETALFVLGKWTPDS